MPLIFGNSQVCRGIEDRELEVGFGHLGLGLLRGSWDLVTRVIIKVTILIITYNPT